MNTASRSEATTLTPPPERGDYIKNNLTFPLGRFLVDLQTRMAISTSWKSFGRSSFFLDSMRSTSAANSSVKSGLNCWGDMGFSMMCLAQ